MIQPGELAILLMPPIFGGLLLWRWPRVRRVRPGSLLLYVIVMTAVLAATHAFVARLVGGRVLPVEVFWSLYFLAAWRFAWAVWSRTVGRVGEPRRRLWRRRVAAGRTTPIAIRLIAPARFTATLLLFVPLLLGSLIHRIKIGNPADLGPYAGRGIESVTFATADGLTLSGWFWPERNADRTVVICHGAGANKGNFIDYLSLFHGNGYNALIFDFRAHGDSDGHTSTFGLREAADVRAAVDWLKRDRPLHARRVFGIGSSMGAMALVRAAADDPRIEAVILDSCFVSADVLRDGHLGRIPFVGRAIGWYVTPFLSLHAAAPLSELDARPALAKLAPRPVLFIHGDADTLIPPWHMQALYDATSGPKEKWLGPGPHSNVLSTDFDAYERRVLGFLSRVH